MTAPDGGGVSIEIGDVEFVENPDGIKAMLFSDGVVAAVAAQALGMAAVANGIAVEAGADYAVTVVGAGFGGSRVRANVWTANSAARRDEAKHSTLLKALASG